MDSTHTMMATWGSLLVMAVVRSRKLILLQSSIGKPRRSAGGLPGSNVPVLYDVRAIDSPMSFLIAPRACPPWLVGVKAILCPVTLLTTSIAGTW